MPQALPVPAAQFLQFRTKIMNKQLDRFGNRVEFTGNPTKYDVSFTLNNVQLEDEGTYNCYVLNPPDRQRGHASISLKVLTKGRWGAVPSPGRHPRVLGWLRALPPALPLPRGCLRVGAAWADPALSPQSPRSVTRRWPSSWAPQWAASWLWSSSC